MSARQVPVLSVEIDSTVADGLKRVDGEAICRFWDYLLRGKTEKAKHLYNRQWCAFKQAPDMYERIVNRSSGEKDVLINIAFF